MDEEEPRRRGIRGGASAKRRREAHIRNVAEDQGFPQFFIPVD